MRKKNKKILTSLVVLLALLAAAYFINKQFFSAKAAVSYATAPVVRGNIENTVLASGVLEASQQVAVGAQVSGQLKNLAVALGQNVKAGDLIAEIDSLTQQNALRNAEAALTTSKAQLRSHQANLAQAKLTFERQKQLRAADASSRAEFEAAEAAYEVALASVESQKAQVAQAEISADTARLNLGYTRITAPMDGQVVAIVTKEGQTVNANQSAPTIIILAQLETMTIKAQISEADVTKVKPGLPVYFTILGEPEQRFEATLRTVEPAPDSISSTTSSTTSSTSASTATAVYYNGLFDVPNPDGQLRISMTAQVYIVRDQAQDVLTIPASALGRRGPDGNYMVRVLDAEGQPEPRRVAIGLNNNITAEVKDGLSEGDRVVVADAAGTGNAPTGGMPGQQRNAPGGAGGPRGPGGNAGGLRL